MTDLSLEASPPSGLSGLALGKKHRVWLAFSVDPCFALAALIRFKQPNQPALLRTALAGTAPFSLASIGYPLAWAGATGADN